MTVPFDMPPFGRDEIAPERPDPSLFARIEGLVGEEDALLAIPAQERTQQQHDRLRDIGDQLDRIWEALRARAKRLEERPATH
jgi:hypothetical protein